MYELLGKSEDVPESELANKCGKYSEALELYKRGDFIKAGELFEQLDEKYNDQSSKLMSDRCRTLIQDKPADWKGVWKMDAK